MKALISPEETTQSYDGSVIGQRVAQIDPGEGFPIAPPLFWADYNGPETNPDKLYWDGAAVQEKPLAPAQNAPTAPDGGPTVVT